MERNKAASAFMAVFLLAAMLVSGCLSRGPGAAAPAQHPTEYLDVTYATVNGTDLKLDLYLPENASDAPLIVTIHGGAFVIGDKRTSIFVEDRRMAQERGYAVATVNYRLGRESAYPDGIHDVKGAIRFLRAHASEYGLDKDNFFVIGKSAGGGLSALAGTSGNAPEIEGDVGGNIDESSAVSAFIDLYGPTEFDKLHEQREAMKSGFKGDGKMVVGCDGLDTFDCQLRERKAGAMFYVDASDPPALILHGDADPIVPLNQSIDFHNALTAAGVNSTLIIVPGMGHGGPELDGYMEDFLDFFDAHRNSRIGG
jgi:acetyl esterase/lipase